MRVRSHGHRFAAPVVATLVGVVALGPLLTGCSDGDGRSSDAASSPKASSTSSESPSGSPSGSPSESPTESPSASPTPRPPKPPKPGKDTPDARKAFASFVVARWGYALRTNDAGVVTGLSPKKQTCAGCKDFAAELAKRRKQRWYVDFPGAKVRSVKVTADGPQAYLARATVDVPASKSYFRNGAFRNDNEAHRGATFFVRMHYVGKHYDLLGFEVR